MRAELVKPLPSGLSLARLREVEDAGLRASQPPSQQWLDGWLVRLQPGKAKRARCINAIDEGERSLTEKLSTCQALYRAAGLPCYLRITPFSAPAGLDAALAARGWTCEDATRVLVRPDLAAVAPAAPPAGVVVEEGVPAADYAQAVGTLRGSSPAQIEAHAERLASSPVPYRGVIWRVAHSTRSAQGAPRLCDTPHDPDARDTPGMLASQASQALAFSLPPGTVLACGQVACAGELAGLYDVFTAPAVRNRGLSTALCASLLHHAAQRGGARVGYLQVDADNVPARRVYARLGFLDAYGYHYRLAPGL